jgi:hypothetical protein
VSKSELLVAEQVERADFSSADICSAKPPAVPEAVKRHRKPPRGRVLQGFHEPPPKSVTVRKMVGHQAVAEERERVPCLGASEIAKEHIRFAVGAEDIGPVVPAVDRVVNKVIACRSWKSSHESNLPT